MFSSSFKRLIIFYLGNMIAYAIFDEIILIQSGDTNKSYFIDTLKRNFAYAR